MNQKQIRAAVEAMLFACGEPIGSDKLAQAVQLPVSYTHLRPKGMNAPAASGMPMVL